MDVRSSGGDGAGTDRFIGHVVANHRVVGRIGQGGMGAVYLAQHTVLGRYAAIKVLLPEYSHNRDLVERFLDEARATARLRYRGFVEIFDSGMLGDGSAYLVMEYLRGANLGAAIEWRRTLEPGEALAVLRDVAASVARAHAHGIVHRDLKPDNIFLALGDDPEEAGVVVKVLDFGIAKLTGSLDASSRAARTRTGSLMGTPIYMSPEQCRGAGLVDHRTDIYSLGCIAYHALTGQPPFAYAGLGEIIAAHLNQAPVPPRTLVPSLPGPVEGLVLQLLEKNPARRPQTMEDVVAALDEAARGDLGPAPDLKTVIPPGALEDAAAATTPTPPPGATAPLADVWRAANPFPPPRAASDRAPPAFGLGPGPGPGSIGTLGGAASEIRAELGLRPRWGRRVGIASGVAAVLGGGVMLVLALRGPGSRPTPTLHVLRPAAPIVEPPPAPPAPEPTLEPVPAARPDPAPARAASERTPITVGSVPAGAQVFDLRTGHALGETPFEAVVPAGATALELVVRKSGYHPKRVRIDPRQQNKDVSVTLEKRTGAGPRAPDDDEDRRKL